MASASSLYGVMKWLRRDEWNEAFSDLLEKHLRPACSKWDVEIDELSSVIGDDWFMNLWGCAFEDFLTREFADNRNIVDDYLKRRGWKESATNKAYMAALRSSVMSLYEVSDIILGESFLARDLIRGGDPIRISEKSATRSLHSWDRIGARVLRLGSKAVMEVACCSSTVMWLKTCWNPSGVQGGLHVRSPPNSRARSGGRLTIRSLPRRSATARYCALRHPCLRCFGWPTP